MKLTKSVLIPSLSGLQYGYNTSVIAGALLFITEEFSLTPLQEGIVVATAIIGLCLASFAGILSNYIGRKKSLILSALCFLIGGALCTLAPSYHFLLWARFLVGLGCGIAVVVAPIYLVETAPAEQRGSILNLNQIGIASGALLSYLFSYLFESWRLLFAIALIPATLQFIGLFFIRESADASQRTQASWAKLLAPTYRSRLKQVLTLSFFQALTGNSAIFFFAPRLFENVGFTDPKGSLLATVYVGITYLLGILFSFWVIDRWGRRPLFFSSLGGMILSLSTISLASFSHIPALNIIALICTLLYIASYSIGAGPVVPLVIGEISPVPVRGHAMSLMGAIGWLTNYFITLTFLPLMTHLTLGGVLLIYVLFNAIGFGIFFFTLPETKQKSLEEIERLFH